MVKKMQKPNPSKSSHAHLTGSVKDSAQQIWQAGLGAFTRAQAEGSKAFESLVKEGVSIQRKTAAAAEEKISEATNKMSNMATDITSKASGQWDKLENIFEERVAKALNKLGVQVFESEIRSVADIGQSLRRIGELTGHGAEGEAQARKVELDWARLRSDYASRSPVRVFYQVWHQPLMTFNRDHLIHEAITACGGVNVFAELPALTPTVSWEAAVQRNPQVIAMAGAASDHPDRGQWPRFPQVDAVRHQRFVQIDGDLIGRMGPRFVQGARRLCEGIDTARH